ncbi:hypothetical protein IWX50DRAFT_638162 [Phyllosticta citricarpa]
MASEGTTKRNGTKSDLNGRWCSFFFFFFFFLWLLAGSFTSDDGHVFVHGHTRTGREALRRRGGHGFFFHCYLREGRWVNCLGEDEVSRSRSCTMAF